MFQSLTWQPPPLLSTPQVKSVEKHCGGLVGILSGTMLPWIYVKDVHHRNIAGDRKDDPHQTSRWLQGLGTLGAVILWIFLLLRILEIHVVGTIKERTKGGVASKSSGCPESSGREPPGSRKRHLKGVGPCARSLCYWGHTLEGECRNLALPFLSPGHKSTVHSTTYHTRHCHPGPSHGCKGNEWVHQSWTWPSKAVSQSETVPSYMAALPGMWLQWWEDDKINRLTPFPLVLRAHC